MERLHPVNRRFALFAGAFAIATLGSLVQADTAEAGRYRFSGGGRVHARIHVGGGGYSYRPSYRPYRSWSYGGHIYVGPRYSYYPRYRYYPRYYYYTPVPSYYGVYSYNYYYPVQAEPRPVVQNTVVAPPPRPELPRFGIGLFAGGVAVEDQDDSSDVGLLGRVRLTPGLLVEAEIGKTSYEDDLRVDRRLGGSLVYEIGAYNKLAPYVLAGLGVQQADVAGEYKTRQNFGEIGIGLRWAISPNFHLLFDVRAGSRATAEDNESAPTTDIAARSVTPPSAASGESEEYTRARFAAMLYF
jgi:hypothetical protein